jgi:[ribosomal protein S5]-alanine N-acetyltransferase
LCFCFDKLEKKINQIDKDMAMELIPIKNSQEENIEFIKNPLFKDTIYVVLDFYQKVGFMPPWICYFAKQKNKFVGSAGFKGPPVNGSVEIAYGTFEKYRKKGIGTALCKTLVDLAQKTDPSIRITARTLPENNFSTRILEINNFEFIGTVMDPEDGEVREWEYRSNK